MERAGEGQASAIEPREGTAFGCQRERSRVSCGVCVGEFLYPPPIPDNCPLFPASEVDEAHEGDRLRPRSCCLHTRSYPNWNRKKIFRLHLSFLSHPFSPTPRPKMVQMGKKGASCPKVCQAQARAKPVCHGGWGGGSGKKQGLRWGAVRVSGKTWGKGRQSRAGMGQGQFGVRLLHHQLSAP